MLAAALLAVDSPGIGGVVLRGRSHAAVHEWLDLVRALLAPDSPMRRVPSHITDDMLLGSVDVAATLAAGRPIAERGLLAKADGGIIVVAGAERLDAGRVARIASIMDVGVAAIERDGLSSAAPARFGVVAIDESQGEDEAVSAAFGDRLAIHLDVGDRFEHSPDADLASAVARARASVKRVRIDDRLIATLCEAGLALGIGSVRAPLLAVRVARAAAALAGRDVVEASDIEVAAAFVLAPRATHLPAAPPADDAPEQQPDAPDDQAATYQDQQTPLSDEALQDLVLAAVQAALPAGLLASLSSGAAGGVKAASGRSGAMQKANGRGRKVGVRTGRPRSGARLNIIETLRAAAPWQAVRRREALAAGRAMDARRVLVRPDDFRIARVKHQSETTTIFVVDASGSSALHRLAEAKGAVELLLSDCYVRRDRVALVAFRGKTSEILLPPTRSLARAKRCLARLPGGGATPLAAGIDQALEIALGAKRKGQTPAIVMLTDGKANISRKGEQGRAAAEAEALIAARNVKVAGLSAVVIDTAPRRQPQAERLSESMGARYVPMPYADAATLSKAIRHIQTTS